MTILHRTVAVFLAITVAWPLPAAWGAEVSSCAAPETAGKSGVALGILLAVFLISTLVVGGADGVRCLAALGWCAGISALGAWAAAAG